jgi:hypothetical protein
MKSSVEAEISARSNDSLMVSRRDPTHVAVTEDAFMEVHDKVRQRRENGAERAL